MKNQYKQVLIGLGSNLNEPKEQLKIAQNHIAQHPDINCLRCSSYYESKPQGPQDQENFINAAVLIETGLTPLELLIFLQSIEKLQGRVKKRHWGERCIDLDILFIGQENIQLAHPDLSVPHPYALHRDFVIIPCLEICPEWQLPDGSLLETHLHSCLNHELTKLSTDHT